LTRPAPILGPRHAGGGSRLIAEAHQRFLCGAFVPVNESNGFAQILLYCLGSDGRLQVALKRTLND
jgi:hypothetical protein